MTRREAPMLVPRFTLRFLLVLTAVAALFSFIGAAAVRGHEAPLALVVACGTVMAGFLLCAAMFCLAWLLAQVAGYLRGPSGPRSPFASSDSLPPQVIPQRPDLD